MQNEPASYAGYIATAICSAFPITPAALTTFFASFPEITFMEAFDASVMFTTILFIPACLYAFIIGWFIKILDLRKTPSGQIASVIVSTLPGVCLIYIFARILNELGSPIEESWGIATCLLSVALAIPAALLSFLLPKPDTESEKPDL